jgi:hypothetical protein
MLRFAGEYAGTRHLTLTLTSKAVQTPRIALEDHSVYSTASFVGVRINRSLCSGPLTPPIGLQTLLTTPKATSDHSAASQSAAAQTGPRTTRPGATSRRIPDL